MANDIPSSLIEAIFKVRGQDPLTQSLSTIGPNLSAATAVLQRQRQRTHWP